jgi:small-conductance mechanosensitive channel
MFSKLQSHHYFIPGVISLLCFLVLLLVRTVLRRYWKQWNRKNPNQFSPRALAVTRIPSVYWCLAIALHFGIELSDLPPQQSHQITKIIHVTLILSIFNALSQIAVMACKAFLLRSNGLLLGLVRGTFVVVGILIALSVLGISIAPVLTALGVGGLAVALALKDTLENLFAGLYLLSEGALKVGDLIRLDSNQEGVILDIGWRTTKIKTAQNNALLIPNSKLSQSLVTNFNLPEQKIGVTLPVSVGVQAELNQVEKLLLDIVRKSTEDVAGVLNTPEATVIFVGLQPDGNLLFNLNVQIQSFKQQTSAISELKKRIFKSLMENQIPLPQPDPRLLTKT